MYRYLYLLLLVLSAAFAHNDRPIIGILAQENEGEISEKFPEGDSYIPASYVKYLEGSGARVVPVWIKQSTAYYESVVDYLNGLLFPGGSAQFNETGGYYDAGRQLYNLAVRKNDAGVYFPIWGTSLGFQLLAVLSGNGTDIRTACNVNNVPLPLHFTQDFRNSSIFGKDIFGIADILQRQNVTINFHDLCITEQNLSAAGVLREWHILSVSEHGRSGQFISMMEHRKYPFYGVQFHPEKNIFEWAEDNTPHFPEAILVSQFLANFFVNEARRNHNQLPDENQFLIYKYSATHTGGQFTHFEQVYFFQENNTISLPTTTTTTTTTTTSTTTTTASTLSPSAVASPTTRRTQIGQEAVRAVSSKISITHYSTLFITSVLLLIVQNRFLSESSE